MNKVLGTLLATVVAGLLATAPARAQTPFMFGVVGNTFTDTEHESLLIKSLSEADSVRFPFVVVNGIKAAGESCSDGLYQQRRDILSLAETPVMVSLTAADWTGCNNQHSQSIATERLGHVRDVFFNDTVSLGQHTLPVVRQSVSPQFRRFAENTRWESHGVLFATLNIPAPNNHWIKDGGRNSEFEDRSIANIDWLNRVFLLANVKKSPGIVLFSDANFLATRAPFQSLLHEERDGFTEIRQHLLKLAATYKGQILLVHSQTGDKNPPEIQWTGKIGQIAIQSPWMAIHVTPSTSGVFTLQKLKDIPDLVPAPAVGHEKASVAQ